MGNHNQVFSSIPKGRKRFERRGILDRRQFALSLLCLAGCRTAIGTGAAPLDAFSIDDVIEQFPPYQPLGPAEGTVSIWGHGSFKRDFMGRLVNRWISEFRANQHDVRFEYEMYGTASAVGAVYTGAGSIAILGEEISPAAKRAFEREKGYSPTGVMIATGSLDVNYFDYAHMVFVHKDNPIRALSLPQLEAIFGEACLSGCTPVRVWGELGLTGAWRHQKIQPYGWETDEDFGLFFRERVLHDSHRWNPAIREYAHLKYDDGTQYDHGQRIIDALARDRYGIAISNVRYATGSVRALELGWKDGGPFYAPKPQTLISQQYPLTRIIPAYVDRAPGQPLQSGLREFLNFLLSREGQQAMVEESGYLPIDPELAQTQLMALA
jgi:phosphate transport system substrate-binding protein